jgi:quinoprotein dehydrogenase-associated probable ABC transporter substrate-binding protein
MMESNSMRRNLPLLSLAAAFLAALFVPATAQAQNTSDLVSRTELRVCADPANLPFSNNKEEGFENKIAQILGKDLNLPVSYVWFPQVVGFVRNTLAAHRCDLIMGTVAGDEMVQTSNPYYYTSYVMLYRSDKGLSLTGIDDPKLQSLTVGVVAGTPPTDLILKYKLADRMRSYALVVDTRFESPTHEMIKDVADGKIDVGLLWGPIAGYYVRRDKLPITFVPLKNEPGMPRMDYHIAMGVRPNEPEWRRQINAAIVKEHDAIVAVLKDFGMPLLDEQGNLIP